MVVSQSTRVRRVTRFGVHLEVKLVLLQQLVDGLHGYHELTLDELDLRKGVWHAPSPTRVRVESCHTQHPLDAATRT